MRRPVLRLLPLLLLTAIGCGGSKANMGAVTGTVRFTDGTVPQGEVAVIRFEPAPGSQAEIRKAASGTIGADGSYELMTVKPGDGALVGSYKVVFTVNKTYHGRESLLPEKYTRADATPFEKTVERGANRFDFQLEKP